MEPAFEVLAEGLGFPEGPVVLPDGSVIVMEMMAGRISRVWGQGRSEVVAQTGGGPNGAQLGPDGALYVCNNGGRWSGGDGIGRIDRVDLSTGRFERLYDSAGGRPLGAPNDIVFDAAGGFWFTDFGVVGERTIDKSGLCYARPDGREIREVYFGGIGYNGVGLSPDETTLYVACTWSGRLCRFVVTGPGRIDEQKNMMGSSEIYVGSAPGDGHFDSLGVTAAGSVCVATLGAGGITSFAPDGASRFIPMPDHVVTNIAFGGEDMRDAYLTFSETGRLVKMRWDEPGLRLNFG
jgi:gluconolactonase